MRRFIFFLIILVLSVWIGIKIAQDPGYALFAYKNWSVEMPLWFSILSLIILVCLLFLILRIFDSIGAGMMRWKNWRQWRRKHKAYSKTNRGLIELLEEQWRRSEDYLLEGVAQSDAPLINYLAAAKAAHEQAAYERRDAYLIKAQEYAPHAEVAIGLTKAQLEFDQGKFEEALTTANYLKSVSPKHKAVLKLIERIYVHLGNWDALIKLLPSLYKAKIIDAKQLDQLENRTYQSLIKSNNQSIETLHAVWMQIPRRLQKDPDVILTYSQALENHPNTENEIESLIRYAMKKNWHTQLAKVYGLVNADAKKQLITVEDWARRFGDQPTLLLTLGRLCVRCQLWGKARSCFEESLRLEKNPETYLEYGKLMERLDDENAAARLYKEGLQT